MARRKVTKKTIRRHRKNQNKKLFNYFKKSEFWIGLATVSVILALLSRLSLHGFIESARSYRVMIVKVTPTSMPKMPVRIMPISHQPQPKPTNQTYVIQDGDSYFTATQKVCGDGTYYEYNQQLNSDKPLQIGDSIIIRCNWQ